MYLLQGYSLRNHRDKGITMRNEEKSLASYKDVAKLFQYDPDTGEFTYAGEFPRRKKTVGNKKLNKSGNTYLVISCGGRGARRNFYAHRLAWVIHYGELPCGVIDHVDGNGLNNSISNLRCVTQSENLRNSRRRESKSGATGVREVNGKWQARIVVCGKEISLGVYISKDDAVLARQEANKKYGFTRRHGEEISLRISNGN